MRSEIDNLINVNAAASHGDTTEFDEEEEKRKKYEAMQNQLNMQFNKGPADHPVSGFIVQEDEQKGSSKRQAASDTYKGGMYSGYELSRSHKLDKDPIMELKHIIGY